MRPVMSVLFRMRLLLAALVSTRPGPGRPRRSLWERNGFDAATAQMDAIGFDAGARSLTCFCSSMLPQCSSRVLEFVDIMSHVVCLTSSAIVRSIAENKHRMHKSALKCASEARHVGVSGSAAISRGDRTPHSGSLSIGVDGDVKCACVWSSFGGALRCCRHVCACVI